MNGSKHVGSSRAKVTTGSINEEFAGGGAGQSMNLMPRPQLKKKSSWTSSNSFATKTRRFQASRKRKTSLPGTTTNKKDNEICPTTKRPQSFEKSLEDYTSWCNHYLLRGLHREIKPDLRTAVGDGITLVNLVESLTSKSIHGITRSPSTWSQKLENINVCFQFLKYEGVVLHGISPEDIIEGQLKAILSLFNRLENHFECVSHPGRKQQEHSEKLANKTYPPNSPLEHNTRNGRFSSGYHTEEDGYMDGRTTPIIDVLPGLLTGSETDSDEESTIIETSDVRLQHGDDEGSPPHAFSPSSKNHHTSQRHHSAFNDYRKTRNSSNLDHIGYMPSHPSSKTRISPDKQHDTNNNNRSLNNRNSFTKTIVKTSYIDQNPLHSVFQHSDESGAARDNYGLNLTAADFGIDDSTSFDRESISSTATPLLPDLSSASSFEDLPLDFSSDASGFTRENFTTSTQLLHPDLFQKGEGKSNSDIEKQVEALRGMYQKLLVMVNKENQRKQKWNSPKMAALQAKTKNTSKQRTKDMKFVDHRFARLESNVVTLARSVDHLRSEIRSQADTSRQVDELREDMRGVKDSVYSNNYHRKHFQGSRGREIRLHRLQKLKKFFGEEPPMVDLLLQKMGYDRFVPHFKAEEIGILELPYMTEQRLQNLGIPLGPRLRILEEIQKLR